MVLTKIKYRNKKLIMNEWMNCKMISKCNGINDFLLLLAKQLLCHHHFLFSLNFGQFFKLAWLQLHTTFLTQIFKVYNFSIQNLDFHLHWEATTQRYATMHVAQIIGSCNTFTLYANYIRLPLMWGNLTGEMRDKDTVCPTSTVLYLNPW